MSVRVVCLSLLGCFLSGVWAAEAQAATERAEDYQAEAWGMSLAQDQAMDAAMRPTGNLINDQVAAQRALNFAVSTGKYWSLLLPHTNVMAYQSPSTYRIYPWTPTASTLGGVDVAPDNVAGRVYAMLGTQLTAITSEVGALLASEASDLMAQQQVVNWTGVSIDKNRYPALDQMVKFTLSDEREANTDVIMRSPDQAWASVQPDVFDSLKSSIALLLDVTETGGNTNSWCDARLLASVYATDVLYRVVSAETPEGVELSSENEAFLTEGTWSRMLAVAQERVPHAEPVTDDSAESVSIGPGSNSMGIYQQMASAADTALVRQALESPYKDSEDLAEVTPIQRAGLIRQGVAIIFARLAEDGSILDPQRGGDDSLSDIDGVSYVDALTLARPVVNQWLNRVDSGALTVNDPLPKEFYQVLFQAHQQVLAEQKKLALAAGAEWNDRRVRLVDRRTAQGTYGYESYWFEKMGHLERAMTQYAQLNVVSDMQPLAQRSVIEGLQWLTYTSIALRGNERQRGISSVVIPEQITHLRRRRSAIATVLGAQIQAGINVDDRLPMSPPRSMDEGKQDWYVIRVTDTGSEIDWYGSFSGSLRPKIQAATQLTPLYYAIGKRTIQAYALADLAAVTYADVMTTTGLALRNWALSAQ